MVWGGNSVTCKKTRLVMSEGHLDMVPYQDKILQPVAIAYLHNLGPNPILQDDNAPLDSCMPSGGAAMKRIPSDKVSECPRSDH